ncbi:porin [Caballeronia sordidicola]|uniref:Porin n=1 Tax=Caballeronia sordidicola TaxID=196367 RepID=A0A158GWC6_CABSO|nr:porin [Caballeronia sordidicola]SAL36223.1 porin [Caballeronia sordidicola]
MKILVSYTTDIGRFFFVAIALFACPFAHAQTSTLQLYGLIDEVVGNFKASGDPSSVVGLMNGGQITSFYGIRGTEDLGGGLKAGFAVESYILANTGQGGRYVGDALYSRNAYVEIASPYGLVRFGRQVTPLFYIMAKANPMGGSFRFSPLMTQTWIVGYGRTMLGDTGWDSAALYQSPSILGVTFSVQATAPGNGTHNETATLVYDHGPLYIAGVAQRVKTGLGVVAPIYRQDAYFLGATYDFNYVRLYASYTHTASFDFGIVNDTYHGGVSIPIGVSSLEFAYSRTNSTREVGSIDAHRNTAGATFDYPLSKRTDVYVSYLYDKLSGTGTANSFGAGIKHRF